METERTLVAVATDHGGTADWATTTPSSPSPADAVRIRNVGLYVHFCAVGVIVPVGLVCNAFSIGIFLTATKFRRTSTGQLLIALSAVDWLVLVGDALRWLTKIDGEGRYITGLSFYDTSDFACKFVNSWRYRYYLRAASAVHSSGIQNVADAFIRLDYYFASAVVAKEFNQLQFNSFQLRVES